MEEFDITISVPDEKYTPNEGRIIATMVHMYFELTKTSLSAALAAIGEPPRINGKQAQNAATAAAEFIQKAFPDVRVTVHSESSPKAP